MSCGVLALYFEAPYAILLILLAGILDIFDGMVARLLNAESEFGKELDSLADLVTFGVAPAFIITSYLPENYFWIAVIPSVTGAIRLAKFNIKSSKTNYFEGLAIPGSALFMIGLIQALHYNMISFDIPIIIGIILTISLLNLIPLKMYSFKGLGKDRFVHISFLIVIVVAIITWFIDRNLAILYAMITYLITSIIYHFRVKNVTL